MEQNSPPECRLASIPRELHRSGRPAIPFEDLQEQLYRRFAPIYSDSFINGKVPAAIFDSVGCSLNRSQFSSPVDVLYDTVREQHYFHWGIVAFQAAFVEGKVFAHPQIEGRSYTIRLEHVPEPCMYAHSELPVFDENGQKVRELSSKTLRTAIKKVLADHSVLIKELEIAGGGR